MTQRDREVPLLQEPRRPRLCRPLQQPRHESAGGRGSVEPGFGPPYRANSILSEASCQVETLICRSTGERSDETSVSIPSVMQELIEDELTDRTPRLIRVVILEALHFNDHSTARGVIAICYYVNIHRFLCREFARRGTLLDLSDQLPVRGNTIIQRLLPGFTVKLLQRTARRIRHHVFIDVRLFRVMKLIILLVVLIVAVTSAPCKI